MRSKLGSVLILVFLAACASGDVDTTPTPESRALQKELLKLAKQSEASCKGFEEAGDSASVLAKRVANSADLGREKRDLILLIDKMRVLPPYPLKAGELQRRLTEDRVRYIEPVWLLSNVMVKASCKYSEYSLASPVFLAIEKKKLGVIDQKSFYRILLKRIRDNPEYDGLLRLLMLSNWMANMATVSGSPLNEDQKKEALEIKEEAFEVSDKFKSKAKLGEKLSAEDEKNFAKDYVKRTPKAIREAHPLFQRLKQLASEIRI